MIFAVTGLLLLIWNVVVVLGFTTGLLLLGLSLFPAPFFTICTSAAQFNPFGCTAAAAGVTSINGPSATELNRPAATAERLIVLCVIALFNTTSLRFPTLVHVAGNKGHA